MRFRTDKKCVRKKDKHGRWYALCNPKNTDYHWEQVRVCNHCNCVVIEKQEEASDGTI